MKIDLLVRIEAKPEFEGEDGRQAHLNGKIAAALGQMAETMLSSAPVIAPVDLLGYKVS